MASLANARKNDLNHRARDFGRPEDEQLSTQDIDTLIAFYDYTCLKCGTRPANSPDHVKPLSKGGENKLSNLQNLCVSCNKAKGDDEIDYRQGKVCSDELHQEQATKQTTKHKSYDWQALRLEYVTGQMSLRDFAEAHDIPRQTVEYQSLNADWDSQRQMFRDKIEATSAQRIAEKEIDARVTTFEVGMEIVEDWRRNIKRSTSAAEVTNILKVLLALQGLTSERTQVNVTDEPDEADALARIAQVFDGARARGSEPTYSSLGEEAGAGYSDSI